MQVRCSAGEVECRLGVTCVSASRMSSSSSSSSSSSLHSSQQLLSTAEQRMGAIGVEFVRADVEMGGVVRGGLGLSLGWRGGWGGFG